MKRTWEGSGAAWAGVAISVLAAVALALTVYVSTTGWGVAEEPLIRGEGESLVAKIHDDVGDLAIVTNADLVREIERRRENGLKYVAIVHPEEGLVAYAGIADMPNEAPRAGAFARTSSRAHLVETLAPPRHGAPRPPPPEMDDFMRPPPPHEMNGPPLIVIEFEPRVVAKMSTTIVRTENVAGSAAIVLVALAVFLSIGIARANALEKKLTRDQKLIALGQMSTVMAHELRNPLASLKGHAQLLAEMLAADSAADPKAAKKAARVVTEAERLEKLTNDLLDFVREKPMARASVDLGALAKDVTTRVASKRGRVEVEETARTVDGDAARLSIALGNLVRNALQATEGDEEVLVRVSAAKNEMQIAVIDSGAGVPPGEEARIFEPFVTTRVHGTGLGLAVARDIVERHGGTLSVENNAGGGAVFTMMIPSAVKA